MLGAVVLVGALTGGIVAGGHANDFSNGLIRITDGVAAATGFRVETVSITGNEVISDETVLDTVGLLPGGSLVAIDARAARERLETLPWIAEARVRKLFPDTLEVRVEERQPFAVWQKDGAFSIIDATGVVLRPANPQQLPDLPVIAGEGAHERVAQLFHELVRYPQIADAVVASVRVADRRWTLHLRSGIEVRLPEGGVSTALERLDRMSREDDLLRRDIDLVDLRIAGRVFVRPRTDDETDSAGRAAS